MSDEVSPPPGVSFRDALATWSRVAALSFGGPAGQIAVMHRIIVDEKKWIDEGRFLHALNYCMLLPGPEAQQLATYIGWMTRGTGGGLLAGILFVLPGALAILALSFVYATYQDTAWITALFFGLKPAVMAIVAEAVLRIGKRVLKNGTMVLLAALAFASLFFFGVPFPLVILAAAAIGFAGGKLWPEQFVVLKGHAEPKAGTSSAREPARVSAGWTHVLKVSAICLTLWFGPLILLSLALGPDSVFVKEGIFFSEAAVVTFGGAYSVLAYVAQQAVELHGWLLPGEMLDGLGMAETTPGPLIMVVQFVGFMGAYRSPGSLDPLLAGILGSLVTTWVTFVPCFYFIFLGAPFIERLRNQKTLTAGLSAITAAVVGIVLNLSIWFMIHVLFKQVATWTWGPLRVEAPVLASLDVRAAGVAALAFVLTFGWKKGMVVTLAGCAAVGSALYFFT